MAAKKRLWLVRRDTGGAEDGVVTFCRSVDEPRLNAGGWVEEGVEFIQRFYVDELKRLAGISIPKGHVVPVESITITLAGASRKAKVAQ